MTRDLGVGLEDAGGLIASAAEKSALREVFDSVRFIVAERFDESLMILRQVLNWRVEDFLYIRRPEEGRQDASRKSPAARASQTQLPLDAWKKVQAIVSGGDDAVYAAAVLQFDDFMRDDPRSIKVHSSMLEFHRKMHALHRGCARVSDLSPAKALSSPPPSLVSTPIEAWSSADFEMLCPWYHLPDDWDQHQAIYERQQLWI